MTTRKAIAWGVLWGYITWTVSIVWAVLHCSLEMLNHLLPLITYLQCS